MYNRLFNALGSSRLRHPTLLLTASSRSLACTPGLCTSFERALAQRRAQPTIAQCGTDRLHWHLRQHCGAAALPSPDTTRAAISPSRSPPSLPGPGVPPTLPAPAKLPASASAAGAGNARQTGRAPAPPSAPAPAPALAGPAAAPRRRPLGPRTLARTRSAAPPCSGSGGDGRPRRGHHPARARALGPAPPRAAPPPSWRLPPAPRRLRTPEGRRRRAGPWRARPSRAGGH